MKIVQMTFSKTWNLGDYNSEKFEVVAGVEETDVPQVAASDLINFVKTKGNSEITAGQVAQVVKNETTSTKVVEKTNKSSETKKPKGKDAANETVAEPENKKEEANNGNKEKSGEKSSEKTSEKTVSEKSEKVKSGKTTPYSPNEPVHKKLVGEFLDKAAPSWRTNTAPYKEVSSQMQDVEFLDSEGLILESFKVEFLNKVEAQKTKK